MNVGDFLRNLSVIVNAPNGVRQVRDLVFSMALQGRLSEQQSDEEVDEYATTLQRERAELNGHRLQAEVRKLQLQGSPIPRTWKWTTFDAISENIHYGVTAKAVFKTEGTRFLRITDIQGGRVDWSSVPSCDVDPAKLRSSRLQNGDILIARTGGTIGKTYLVENLDTDAVFASYLIRWIPLPSAYPPFIKLFTNSPLYWAQLTEATSGTGQPNVSASSLKRLMIPLPPLEEQKRIVAKVDELMRLCDRLEAQQQEREKLLPLLSRANHTRFVTEPTTKSLKSVFQQHVAVSPSDMRETVLSLAVRGLLAQQQPNDEPVDELLSWIQKQRAEYGSSDVEEVSSDEEFFAIPKSWRWVRLGNISTHSDSGWSPQCKETPRVGDEWGILKVSAVSWGRFLPEENKGLPASVNPRPECEVRNGDFLMSRANTFELVAKSVIVETPPPHLMLSDKIVRFHLPAEIDKSYINLFNLSPWARQYYARNASGTSSSMKNVGRKVMSRLPIPFPPAAEQRRIVSCVQQFMSLIDRLEQKANEKRNTAASFAKAAIAALTSTEFTENERMKPPQTEVVTALKVGRKPKKPDAAPLARLLSEQKAEASAKTLWQLSGLEIDAFYRQLKTEMANGWIEEPHRAFVREQFDLWQKINELKGRLGWEEVTGSIREWWESFEQENRHRPELLLRLLERLALKKLTIASFLKKYTFQTQDIQTVYNDIIWLQKEEIDSLLMDEAESET